MLYENEYLAEYRDQIINLAIVMARSNISQDTINAMIESRYLGFDYSCKTSGDLFSIPLLDGHLICDGYIETNFNDSKGCLNTLLLPDKLLSYIRDFDKSGYTKPVGKYPLFNVEARNISDIISLLNGINQSLPYIHRKIVYRGVTKKYFLQRPFPNPKFSLPGGLGYNLIPSFYRHFTGHMDRIGIDFSNSLEALDILSVPEASALFQHYGLPTKDLDVTFDLMVALFFALNKLVENRSGFYDYIPLDSEEYKDAIIYVFGIDIRNYIDEYRFDRIAIPTITGDVIALRPQRQNCTSLPANHHGVNRAASEIIATITFSPDFIMPVNIPNKTYLFPSPENDEVFSFLLENMSISKDHYVDLCKSMASYELGDDSPIQSEEEYDSIKTKLRIHDAICMSKSKIMRFSFH